MRCCIPSKWRYFVNSNVARCQKCQLTMLAVRVNTPCISAVISYKLHGCFARTLERVQPRNRNQPPGATTTNNAINSTATVGVSANQTSKQTKLPFCCSPRKSRYMNSTPRRTGRPHNASSKHTHTNHMNKNSCFLFRTANRLAVRLLWWWKMDPIFTVNCSVR